MQIYPWKPHLPAQTVHDFSLHTTAGAIALAAGYWHTCALLIDGSVHCWGDGHYGDLGEIIPPSQGYTRLPFSPVCIGAVPAACLPNLKGFLILLNS